MTNTFLERANDERGVATLTFARPEKCNALSLDMLIALLDELRTIERDPAVRVLLLQGRAPCFCSGMDLREAAQGDNLSRDQLDAITALDVALPSDAVERGRVIPRLVQTAIRRLRLLPQVVVGRAQGFACGGGVGLLTGCDLVVAEDTFRFALTEINRGFYPTLLFPFMRKKYPIARLQEVALMARPFDAQTAREIGIVSRVVSPERLDAEIERAIETFLANDRVALAYAKKLFAEATLPTEEEAVEGWNEHWRSWTSKRGREGVAAFLEKRAPIRD